MGESHRKTTQYLAPARRTPTPLGQYDLYPGFPVGPGEIVVGVGALADALAQHPRLSCSTATAACCGRICARG